MIYAQLPAEGDHTGRPLPFYLAMEEWLARRPGHESYFFMWQVDPTVICGRHQDVELETDLGFCRSHGIRVVRRKSGGGCVYADRNNIMMSYITPSVDVVTTFAEYTSGVAAMLRSIGLDATADTSRNDIMISGRKVSGNAFYHLPGRSIVHGTMLYDTDLRHMANAITPSRSKLESKQVQSVESHITTLNRHIDMDIDDFNRYAISRLTDTEITLEPAMIREIEEIERPYYAPEWIFGRRSNATIHACRRIEGVGEPEIGIRLDEERIADIDITGDFFLLSDLDSALLDRLRGVRYTRDDITRALADTDTSQIIAGLSTLQFIDLII